MGHVHIRLSVNSNRKLLVESQNHELDCQLHDSITGSNKKKIEWQGNKIVRDNLKILFYTKRAD